MAAISLHELYMELVYKVYEDDLQSQKYYLSLLEHTRNIPINYLLSRNCLFIPNNNYIRYYLEDRCFAHNAELYRNEQCLWTLFFIFPVQDLSGEVVGLVGWDAKNKYLEEIEEGVSLPTYKVSSKNIFNREQYFLSDVDLLRKKFDFRSIVITDGVFDSVALNCRNIPAISLLGSTVSSEILYFLRWYNRIFVSADNDDAGLKLYKKIKRALPNVYRIKQNKVKDIEEYLREDGLDGDATKFLQNVIYDVNYKSDIEL